jgi:two-component system chemotaxis response regulator CheB
VESAEDALRIIHRVAPDVVSLDIRLPGMQGVEATRRIMTERPTPIVVVSGASDSAETNPAMEALKAGAVSVVEKPAATTHQDYAALAGHLCTQLAIMSEVKVVRQRAIAAKPRTSGKGRSAVPGAYRVLGIAASTGGPSALMEVLGRLGAAFPLPVVVVQHMTPAFVEGFGAWLGTVAPMPVRIVHELMALQPGTVYLAPAGKHIAADANWVWPQDGLPISNHKPSATVLFSSLARNTGGTSIGVLLTGMGDDGAEGLMRLREAGGFTIAEDESSAVVWGMPGVAAQMGAATEVVPLGGIGPRILELAFRPEEEL